MKLNSRQNKKSDSRTSERMDLRRNQIFEAATIVFAEKGYHNATVQDVADKAGLGKGTIYEYVDSKKELLFLVMEEGHRLFFGSIEEAVRSKKTSREKLEALIEVSLDVMSQHRDVARTIIPQVEGMTDEDEKRASCVRDKAISTVKSIIDEGIRKGEFAKVNSYIVGELLLVCCWEYTKSDTIFELSRGTKAYKDIICGVFFNGILPKQTTRREGARKQ